GPAESQTEEAMTGLRKKIDECRRDENDTLLAGKLPHPPFNLFAELYSALNNYTRPERPRLAPHNPPTKERRLFVPPGARPFAENHRKRGIDVKPAGCSPIAYLDRFGLLRPEMLLVHAVDIEDSDLDLLNSRRPAVVHCPKSNAKLAHGTSPVTDIQKTGISI